MFASSLSPSHHHRPQNFHQDTYYGSHDEHSYDPARTYVTHRSTVDDDRAMDSRGLQSIQRKISKQKLAAGHRGAPVDTDPISEYSRPHSTSSSLHNLHDSSRYHPRSHALPPHPTTSYSFPSELDNVLRHSSGSRVRHDDDDVILNNDFDQRSFQPPATRKVTKVISKENYSLSNNRPAKVRSTSASAAHRDSKEPPLKLNDAQRLKQVRRHEPAHIHSGAGLITPESWRTDPVVIKNPAKKNPSVKTASKPPQADVEVLSTERKPPVPVQQGKESKHRAKRDRSASKSSAATEQKVQPKPEKTKEERELLKKYIEQKRHKHDEKLVHEKQSKVEEEKQRKDKLKKLNEQIKKVAQQPLPPALIKQSASQKALSTKDVTEEKRQRMLDLLGPKPIHEAPREIHNNTPYEQPSIDQRSRSSSSSSSSSESIVEIQPARSNNAIVVPSGSTRQEMMNGVAQRQNNILRWALNLTRDCGDIEEKIRYARPDGTQPFDIVAPSYQQLQHDNGNLRIQSPIHITKDEVHREPKVPSKLLRPSGRLSHLNQNRTSEYQGHPLPGVGNLRDPKLEQLVRRDRAAGKIQAAYRGYTVRKSLYWMDQQPEPQAVNKRPAHKSSKTTSSERDRMDAPPAQLDMRFSDDHFTIGSTLLRHFQRNGAIAPSPSPPPSPIPPVSRPARQTIQKPPTVETYSDDYEHFTSTISSNSKKPKRQSSPPPQKPRTIQQPAPERRSSSTSTMSLSSSSTTPTPTPHSPVPRNLHKRRSISPPLAPVISANNGRPVVHQPPPPPPPTATTNSSHRVFDERRYSPDALERQLNAELHLLDGVEASMKQVDNMERLRSVALAQQEVVSLAQVMKNKPEAEQVPERRTRKSNTRQGSSSSVSSSSSSVPINRKRRSSPPHSPSSFTSESILTEREKRVRQKSHGDAELQAYEKRLKTIEAKLHLLSNRAHRVYKDENRKVVKTRLPSKSSHDSSISEDLPAIHRSSSSTISTLPRKANDDTSEIRTDILEKESERSVSTSSSISTQLPSEGVTSNGSDIERRIRSFEKQVNAKRLEVENLEKQKNKEALKQKEDQLKKQLQHYETKLETLHAQPSPPKTQQETKVAVSSRISPSRERRKDSFDSSSSSSSTTAKLEESSIAEELPAASTTSQSRSLLSEKRIEPVRVSPKKDRDFFDDDEDEDDEEDKKNDQKKKVESKLLETPRDERDTQHDALSVSIATDLAASSGTDNDSPRPSTTEKDTPILNFNPKVMAPLESKDNSESSSSSSEKSPKPPPQPSSSSRTTPTEKSPKNVARVSSSSSSSFDQKQTSIHNDYDEDFSEVSHSRSAPKQAAVVQPRIDQIDVESIQEDLEDKHSSHDTNQSFSSKSSGDEQSEILVLVKKSASNTPRRQDDKTLEEDLVVPTPVSAGPAVTPMIFPEAKTESNPIINNDDTSYDVSEEEDEQDDVVDNINEEAQAVEQEKRIDRLTDQFIRTFIDEAIDQGKEIDRLKRQNLAPKKIPLTKAVQEWISDEDNEDDLSDEDDQKELFVRYEEDFKVPPAPRSLPSIAPPAPQLDLPDEFQLDLSHLDEKTVDEPRVESPRKIAIEEPVKPLVPHSSEQVAQISHHALQILFDQNTNFADRLAIRAKIPESFFTANQPDAVDEHVQPNWRAYCQMIFDLCVEFLHEMYSENIQAVKYPQWQKAKLVPKRFFRANKPRNRQEVEDFVQKRLLEVLTLNSRPISYSKYRVSTNRRPESEKFEVVLDEEIRRNESQWLHYDDDCQQVKFNVAESIFEQLINETFTQCFAVVNRRLAMNSHSTRL